MLNKIYEAVGLLSNYSLAWFHFYFNLPISLKLEIDEDYEERLAKWREEVMDVPVIEPDISNELLPPKKRIYVKRLDNGSDFGTNGFQGGVIVIDPRNERIDFGESSVWLSRETRYNDMQTGLLLIITFPLTAIFSPIILLIERCWQIKERKYQMSRHCYAAWRALQGKLDKETEELLVIAMKNSWIYRQKMARRVTFEEAKTLLMKCRLTIMRHREYSYEPTDVHTPQTMFWKYFHWIDEEEGQVAYGTFRYAYDEHYIHVLGSRFTDEQADDLTECFASFEIQIFDEGDPD